MRDVEALIARVADPNVCTDDLHLELATALELLLSPTPTGAELTAEERLLHAIFNTDPNDPRERLARIAERVLEGEVMYDDEDKYRFADAVLAAGFRVAPEPVYEYRVNCGGGWVVVYHTLDDAKDYASPFGNVPKFERRVKAGPWLPVVSTSKEQGNG